MLTLDTPQSTEFRSPERVAGFGVAVSNVSQKGMVAGCVAVESRQPVPVPGAVGGGVVAAVVPGAVVAGAVVGTVVAPVVVGVDGRVVVAGDVVGAVVGATVGAGVVVGVATGGTVVVTGRRCRRPPMRPAALVVELSTRCVAACVS